MRKVHADVASRQTSGSSSPPSTPSVTLASSAPAYNLQRAEDLSKPSSSHDSKPSTWHDNLQTRVKCVAVVFLVVASFSAGLFMQDLRGVDAAYFVELGRHTRSHPVAIALVLIGLLALIIVALGRRGYIKPPCHRCDSKSVLFVLTILTDITPNGFLPLPCLGHGFHPIVSCIVVVLCAVAAARTMSFLHNAATQSSSNSYKELSNAALPNLGLSPSVVTILSTSIMVLLFVNCFGNLVAYLGLAADLLVEEGKRTVLSSDLFPLALNDASMRAFVVVVITVLIFPICVLEGLDGMTATVLLGNASVVFAVLCIVWRCLDGTYLDGGRFFASVRLADTSSTSPGVQQLISFASGITVAFLTHYNVFFYRQNCNDSFEIGVHLAFASAAIIYCVVLIFVWLTFGSRGISPEGVVLNSYSMTDVPLRFARVAVATSILCSFPIMFNGFRDAWNDLAAEWCSQKRFWNPSRSISTAALLVPVLIAAAIFSDVSAVITILGLVCGFGLVYILPTIIKCINFPETGAVGKSTHGKANAELAECGEVSDTIHATTCCSKTDVFA